MTAPLAPAIRVQGLEKSYKKVHLVLVARLRHQKYAGQIAAGLLARFQLADAADRRMATYSGGMRRRLDIAMSLIGNPPVIFLDDPGGNLPRHRRHG